MSLFKYQCPQCKQQQFNMTSTLWQCLACHSQYPCDEGIPIFHQDNDLNSHDKSLRDTFYNGLVGRFYPFIMPLLVLPARPFSISKRYWLFHGLASVVILLSIFHLLTSLSISSSLDMISISVCIIAGYTFYIYPYLFYLFIFALPVKLTLIKSKFKPQKTFIEIHQQLFDHLNKKQQTLEILDISTGSCNSLIRHGWLKLNARFTGLDLSTTMLKQGVKQISKSDVAMDFMIANAADLPFTNDFFDVTTNYGAINGYADIKTALQEMLRVTKPGGTIVLFDENLYDQASWLEQHYFEKVLASHDIVKHCPKEFLPDNLVDIEIHQPYPFYFLLTATKAQGVSL